MAWFGKQYIASFLIYLLISVDLIHAFRVLDVKNATEELSTEVAATHVELQTELQELEKCSTQCMVSVSWGGSSQHFAKEVCHGEVLMKEQYTPKDASEIDPQKCVREYSVTCGGYYTVTQAPSHAYDGQNPSDAHATGLDVVDKCYRDRMAMESNHPFAVHDKGHRDFSVAGFTIGRKISVRKGNTATIFAPAGIVPNDVVVLEGPWHKKIQIHRTSEKHVNERCAELQIKFNAASQAVLQKVDLLKQGVHFGMVKTGKTLLSTRKLVKSLNKANSLGCSWANADGDGVIKLQGLVESTKGMHPCWSKAQHTMEHSQNLDSAEQEKATQKATAILFSSTETCDGPESHADSDFRVPDLDDDELASDLASEILRADEHSLAEIGSSSDLTTSGFGKTLGKVLYTIFLILGFVVLFSVLFLVAMILCTIKFLVYSLVNLFKKKKDKWDNDYGGCYGTVINSVVPSEETMARKEREREERMEKEAERIVDRMDTQELVDTLMGHD